MRGAGAALAALLGLGGLCAPLAALVLGFNSVRSPAAAQGAREGSPCAADADCGPRRFCLAPSEREPFCAACLGPRRRCQRRAVCCPGTLCVNDVCASTEDAAAEPGGGPGGPGTTEPPVEENEAGAKPGSEQPPGQEGESCLRTSDCGPRLCCARHFWTKICKPVLLEGQVCSRRGHKEAAQAPEIFQRCACGPGLTCRGQGGRHHARLRVCRRA